MPTNHSWHRKQCWLLLPSLPTLEVRKAKDRELKQQLCAIWRDSVSSARLLGSRGRTTELLLKITQKENEYVNGVRSINMLAPICSTIAEGISCSCPFCQPIFPLATVKIIRNRFVVLVMWVLPSPEKATVKPPSHLGETAKEPSNEKAITAGLDVGPSSKNLHHQSCKLLCFVVRCWFTVHNTTKQILPRCLHNSVSSVA